MLDRWLCTVPNTLVIEALGQNKRGCQNGLKFILIAHCVFIKINLDNEITAMIGIKNEDFWPKINIFKGYRLILKINFEQVLGSHWNKDHGHCKKVFNSKN